MKDVFLLVKDPESQYSDTIYHQGSTLKIRVFFPEKQHFWPKEDELQFYGTIKGELLVFETVKYDIDEPGLIIEAIRWYSKYLGNPKMEILADDPRIDHH